MEQAARLPNAVVEQLDLGSQRSIDALIERLRGRGETIDVLVNNAAVNRRPPKETWEVNVRGPLRLTRGLEPMLMDGARVAMVSSGLGRTAAQSRALNARLRAIRTRWRRSISSVTRPLATTARARRV